MLNNKISCVIAAAGKGSRSGLDYPKCLFKIDGKPIINRILETISFIDINPTIIVSPSGKDKISQELHANNFSARFLVQEEPLGMGNAISQLKKISYELEDNILLSWGDIPFITKESLIELQMCFFDKNSDFSLITSFSNDPYTIIKRDKNNNIIELVETRNIPNYQNEYFNLKQERDIGVFLFKKELILQYLDKSLDGKYSQVTNEHGFLYLIKHLANDGYKITNIKSKHDIETISFNSHEDLKGYI